MVVIFLKGVFKLGNKGIYTNHEIQYLKKNVGYIKLSTIARNLDRPYYSVQIKIKRLGIGDTRPQSGGITMGELARIIQVDRKTVQGYILYEKVSQSISGVNCNIFFNTYSRGQCKSYYRRGTIY
jgi:hypothetical protein